MIVYIAGKMTGLPDLGRAAFMAAEEHIANLGHIVLNPARLPEGMPKERYMPICLAMLEQADAIFLLDGWEDSDGANIELAYANYQDKAVWGMEEGVFFMPTTGSREKDAY